jgi:bacterioferritin
MMPVRADQKVLGYLGRALSLELSAVQLYSTQARLVATWGLDKAADRLRNEAHEEMQHAERIIARMLAHGAAPNASQLRPVKLGPDLQTLLMINQRFELELVQLYQDAMVYCARAANHDDRLFFETLFEEEKQHAVELSNWLAKLNGSKAVGRKPALAR